MRRLLPIVAGGAALMLGLASPSAARQRDYAAVALNVLPPGQSGSLTFGRNATDQLRLYDGLTPLFDRVGAADLGRYFKPPRSDSGPSGPFASNGRPGAACGSSAIAGACRMSAEGRGPTSSTAPGG